MDTSGAQRAVLAPRGNAGAGLLVLLQEVDTTKIALALNERQGYIAS